MKFCKSCEADVSSYHQRCPLCQGILSEKNDDEKPSYLPSYTSFKESSDNKMITYIRLLILVIGIFSVALNIRRPKAGFWSLVIIVTLASLNWWLSIAVKIRRSIIKKFSQMMFLGGSVAVFLDIMFGWKKWSLNYVVPILITVSICIIMVVERAMKISKTERVFYNFLLVVTGLLFTLLILFDIITINVPSYVLLFVCIVSLCHSLLFERHELANELQKRFHI